MGNLDVTQEEIDNALVQANAAEFVSKVGYRFLSNSYRLSVIVSLIRHMIYSIFYVSVLQPRKAAKWN